MFSNVYSNRRVLVTGHTGFKGSWLCQWLLQLSAEVVGYSLYIPTEPSNFEVLGLKDRMKSYTGDVRNLEQLSRVVEEFRPQIIFHLAAQPIVKKSYEEPKLTFDTNVGGMVNVLEVVRLSDFVETAILITSDKCYENVEWEYGYRETDRLGGKDPYSGSKACAEIVFYSYAKSYFTGTPTKIATTRAGNVIGGGDWARDRIVPDCIRAWAVGKSPVVRNPYSTRPWQHVLEPLSGYLWLAAQMASGKENLSGEAFNFGPGADVSKPVYELIEEMQATWKATPWERAKEDEHGKKEASLLKLSCDKALARLGWEPTLTFEETIKMTVEWYQQYYSQNTNMTEFEQEQIAQYSKLAGERNKVWVK